jgi:hypothetical protein
MVMLEVKTKLAGMVMVTGALNAAGKAEDIAASSGAPTILLTLKPLCGVKVILRAVASVEL